MVGPTDVLSFPMGAGDENQEGFPLRVLGDLIISLDTAQRQADERGRAPVLLGSRCMLPFALLCHRRICGR